MLNINLIYFILSFNLFFIDRSNNPINEVWEIERSSSMVILGKTNINTFECILGSYEWDSNLTCYQKEDNNQKNYPIKCNFEIPIMSFDCGMNMMTKDLRNTLNSRKHPFMIIKLKELTNLLSNVKKGELLDAKSDITLSGVTNSDNISFNVVKSGTHDVILEGKKKVNLRDFKIEPPTRLLGSVRVKDIINVNIIIRLKKTNF
jgi:hypothetical protein